MARRKRRDAATQPPVHGEGTSTTNNGGTTSDGSVQRPVHFKRQPFYDVLDEVLLPTSLTTSGDTDWMSICLPFQFLPQHVEAIRSSLVTTPDVGAVPQYEVQVHLRFRLRHTKRDQDDRYPSDLTVRVNDRSIAVPAQIPSKTSDGATERICLPINIVSSCFLSSSVRNKVSLKWRPARGYEFVVGALLVRKLSVATLISKLQRRPRLTSSLGRNKSKRQAGDGEIAVTRLYVSLTCPLSKKRMSIPCRTRSCKHLECFDAFSYLRMNEQRPRWLCPVCGKRAPFASLRIDQVFAANR
ncbi:hypothetical protein MTO96_005039 [Rhipicephalus appendiculatus]